MLYSLFLLALAAIPTIAFPVTAPNNLPQYQESWAIALSDAKLFVNGYADAFEVAARANEAAAEAKKVATAARASDQTSWTKFLPYSSADESPNDVTNKDLTRLAEEAARANSALAQAQEISVRANKVIVRPHAVKYWANSFAIDGRFCFKNVNGIELEQLPKAWDEAFQFILDRFSELTDYEVYYLNTDIIEMNLKMGKPIRNKPITNDRAYDAWLDEFTSSKYVFGNS
ncbi:hypothetical protein FRB96_009637 [Tulasnella sp. 330]|nr:hypothetical protein FRB96_009637 [Tulasnella sp. 330]KAG8877070.1 hypothetical protein FRB97_003749 [Tulasnella sp. 331]